MWWFPSWDLLKDEEKLSFLNKMFFTMLFILYCTFILDELDESGASLRHPPFVTGPTMEALGPSSTRVAGATGTS